MARQTSERSDAAAEGRVREGPQALTVDSCECRGHCKSINGLPAGFLLTWRHVCSRKETAMPASAAAEKNQETAHRFAKDQLKAVIERIERLEEEKKTTSDDIREVYAEAKVNGFDIKALRSIVRLRKLDTDERKEQEAVLETYMHALGMLN